jgi:hypothetical protein
VYPVAAGGASVVSVVSLEAAVVVVAPESPLSAVVSVVSDEQAATIIAKTARRASQRQRALVLLTVWSSYFPP